MGEFLSNYGFFIFVAVFMVGCHLMHGHGGHDGREEEERDNEVSREGRGQVGEGRHQH